MMSDWRNWIVARPIAHRGLHGLSRDMVENSHSAAAAALAHDYHIECDVQVSADGEAFVFHDFSLERLTTRNGTLARMPAAELAAIKLRDTSEPIPLLSDFLSRIAGRVGVICEIKSAFDGDFRLTQRVAAIVAAYAGPVALKSFDPNVIAYLRRHAAEFGIAHVPLGIVAEAQFDEPGWSILSAEQRLGMSALTHWDKTRPDFLSWHVGDLPHATASLCRAFNIPVMAWTLRERADLARARAYADQIVFEGFLP